MLGGTICIWLLLFQEFDFEVVVKPRKNNIRPKQLCRIKSQEDGGPMDDELPNAHLFKVEVVLDQFTLITTYLMTGKVPEDYTVA